jgi:iron(III) transport system substrate-binding protein
MKTRREFLISAAGAGALALLAACGQSSAPAASPSSAGPASKPAASAASPKPAGSAGAAAPSAGSPAPAADLSKPVTPKLATLDEELALPQAILDGARKEGKLSWISAINAEPAKATMDAFKKRYPFIDVQHQEASEEVRTVRTLTELKAGRNKVDVAMQIGGFISQYKEAKALVPLTDLPAFANYDVPFRDHENLWVGARSDFWAIGYNTDKVKAGDLPQAWDDLADPKWKGRFGLGDRPQLWVLELWTVWGADRTSAFIKKVFANEPQRRKEGLDASAKLLAAGEYDLYVPVAPYRAENLKQSGSPIGWYSPSPVPLAFSDLAVLANSPNPNAGKVFANWFISREGQGVYSKADHAVPTHPALRLDRDYLGMFADQFLGKQWAPRGPEDESRYMPDIRKLWQSLWVGA